MDVTEVKCVHVICMSHDACELHIIECFKSPLDMHGNVHGMHHACYCVCFAWTDPCVVEGHDGSVL